MNITLNRDDFKKPNGDMNYFNDYLLEPLQIAGFIPKEININDIAYIDLNVTSAHSDLY